jgi:hypothetical protein
MGTAIVLAERNAQGYLRFEFSIQKPLTAKIAKNSRKERKDRKEQKAMIFFAFFAAFFAACFAALAIQGSRF